MLKVFTRIESYFQDIHVKINEFNRDYIKFHTIKLYKNPDNNFESTYEFDCALNIIDDITGIRINNYENMKRRAFVITNARPLNISDGEYKLEQDRNNALTFRIAYPKIIIFRDEVDVYMYSNYPIEFDEGIEYEILDNPENYGVQDFVKNSDIIPETIKFKYAKFLAKYEYANPNFYGALGTFATPIGSYLDLENGLVLNFLKFLYEKNDPLVIEFLSSNSKYQKIFDLCLANGCDTVENKSDITIDSAFIKKKFIQDKIKEYKGYLELIEQAQTVDELPEIEPANTIYYG